MAGPYKRKHKLRKARNRIFKTKNRVKDVDEVSLSLYFFFV